jgi:tartrate-resistant acid phosphatase type 5
MERKDMMSLITWITRSPKKNTKWVTVCMCVIAGSLCAQPDSVRFAVIGDFGQDGSAELSVANLVKSWHPDFVVTAGDDSYGSTPIDNNIGKYYADYIGSYVGSYGSGTDTNRFFPSLGNHDYSDGGGINAYLGYFTLPGNNIPGSNSSGQERYYDFVRGSIHFFVINSNSQEPDGISAGSVQAHWLQTQMAASSSPWNIVVLHHPPYSSCATHGSQPMLQWPYEAWGADAVIAGHDHTYERILRDDNADTIVVPYFVNGLGGKSLYSFPASGFVDGSQVRYSANYGAMLVEATDFLMTFRFYSVAGGASGTLIDSYSVCRCHGTTGNLDGDPGDNVDISDVTVLVDYLFFGDPIWNCPGENDVDRSGSTDMSDLQMLIDFLFFDGSLPPCP